MILILAQFFHCSFATLKNKQVSTKTFSVSATVLLYSVSKFYTVIRNTFLLKRI